MYVTLAGRVCYYAFAVDSITECIKSQMYLFSFSALNRICCELRMFNPQISQITQITINVRWRLRNLPGLFLAACCVRIECIIHGYPVACRGEVH